MHTGPDHYRFRSERGCCFIMTNTAPWGRGTTGPGGLVDAVPRSRGPTM